ncbi:MAG: right-handed parallel beta-helix repeat-containing protein [Candidatus Thorarchaeota archaeon]
MRRLTCAILLAILVLQPVVLVTNFMMVPGTFDEGPTGQAILAQVPGSRLDSDEYTNHVPVIINGTADFVSQGWPGSGSAASPYIISGLRIAYDVSMPCISVMNTNAYFVIRDCLIDQGSNEDGIFISNTIHARIEYTTALSYGAAIVLDNANNTEVSHTYAYGFLGMAMEIWDSIYCDIDANHLNSSDHRGFYSYMAHYLSMTNNEILTLAPVWFVSYIEYSNHTSFSLNSYDGGFASFSALMSYDITANDLTMTDGDSGLNINTCGDSTFTRINIVDSGTQGVILINSDSVSIVDSSISVPSGTGVYIVDSNSASVEGTAIDDTANQGVLVENSLFTNIQQNTISNTGSFGVDVQNSNDTLVEDNSLSLVNAVAINANAARDLTVDGNHLFDLGFLAIELLSCDDAIVTDNTVEDTTSYSFWSTSSHRGILADNSFTGDSDHAAVILDLSQNWTIEDNLLDTSYKALLIRSGSDGTKMYRNDIRNLEHSGSMMFQIYFAPNCEIVNNTGYNGKNLGIRLDSSPECLVEGNTIDRVPTGLSTNSPNTTINDNVFSRIAEYAIFIDQGDYAIVTNNIVNSGEYGVYISYSIDSTFTGNTLTNCGFGFNDDQTLVYLNHVFSNNEVNGKPLYYNRGTDGLTLNGDDYGEIILVDCETATITGGEFYNSTSAVQLYRCNEIDVSGVVSKYNHISFQVEYSTNVTISDSSVIGGGEFGAFRARYSDDFVLDTCTVNYTIAPYGVYITYSDRYLIEDCEFEHLSGDAFYQLNSDNGTITGSVFYNVTNGVWISSAQNCVVEYSYFAWAGYAIRSSGPAHYMNVTNNDIHDNLFGIYLSGGDNCIVRNNTVRWNSVVGIYLDFSDNTEVFYNIIALNLGGNSYDDNAAVPNSWDDGVDTGNWWSDFTGSPPYNIPGPSGSTDQYPMNYIVTEPIVNEAYDVFYAEFSEGNEITWYPIDDNLRDWTLEIDGAFWASDAWNFVDITVNIRIILRDSHCTYYN